MRVVGASKHRIFSHFHILKLVFCSTFCWYFRYFRTNNMLVGLHVPTNIQMFRQNKTSIMGEGAIARSPLLAIYANVYRVIPVL